MSNKDTEQRPVTDIVLGGVTVLITEIAPIADAAERLMVVGKVRSFPRIPIAPPV